MAGLQAQGNGGIAHESGELHRIMVDSVRDYAIFALDPKGYILSWNAGAQRIKGYSAEEIVGKHFSIFYPPEKIAERFPEHELEVASETGRFEDEGWRVRKDGTRFWANVVITALRGEGGSLMGFAKITRDLSERRASEVALRDSEQRFRLLVQGVRDYAIFMLDPSGHIATWNEGAARMKGYEESEILGQHMSVFYTPEDIASGKIERELEIARREGKYEEEGERVRKGGTRFWASILISAMHDEQGRLIGFSKVTRDLSERHAAEERALADAMRLAREETARVQAEERARAMQELAGQLREQARLLELRSEEAATANAAKSNFLAAMSHELRTPLNAIGGYAELLEMGISGPVTPRQAEHLERIRRAQQHLLRVINDILNFSRIDAAALTYDIGAVPMREAMSEVVHMIVPQAQKKEIALNLEECAADCIAWADSAKTQQILLNLLSNALKFTRAGGSVWLSCVREDNRIVATVRDTGVGIAPDRVRDIFEPFVQLGRTLTSDHEGTGLGLSISRDLARAMQGDLTVASVVGEGSTFQLRLPASVE